MIGPHRLRHDRTDRIEVLRIHLDPRTARQPNHNAVRGRHHRYRRKDVAIFRTSVAIVRTCVLIPRTRATIVLVGAVIFRTRRSATTFYVGRSTTIFRTNMTALACVRIFRLSPSAHV